MSWSRPIFAPAAGAVTSTVGAAPERSRCHSTGPSLRMRSVRAPATAGTRSENAASGATACSSPVEASSPIGPRSWLTPKWRVWSTAPSASSCSNVYGPSPAPGSGSPSTSAMSPAAIEPSAFTVPVSDSVRLAAARPCRAVAPAAGEASLVTRKSHVGLEIQRSVVLRTSAPAVLKCMKSSVVSGMSLRSAAQ